MIKKIGIALIGVSLLAVGFVGASRLSIARASEEIDEPAAVELSAPPAPTKHDKLTNGKKAPKGRTGLKSVNGQIAPDPLGTSSQGVNFFYGVGSQVAVADGASVNLVIGKPYLAPADFHSLAELSVQSADSQQIVEIGWNVDPTVNGDSDPHLFVYHWINGAGTCYNGCGFQSYDTATILPGATLPANTSKLFGIQYSGGAWWVAYDGQWIGYFPETLWTSQGVASFNKAGLEQAFGELASASTAPCGQMGNGIFGTAANGNAARFGSFTLANSTDAPSLSVRTVTVPDTVTNLYKAEALSERTFRYGGPGGC